MGLKIVQLLRHSPRHTRAMCPENTPVKEWAVVSESPCSAFPEGPGFSISGEVAGAFPVRRSKPTEGMCHPSAERSSLFAGLPCFGEAFRKAGITRQPPIEGSAMNPADSSRRSKVVSPSDSVEDYRFDVVSVC